MSVIWSSEAVLRCCLRIEADGRTIRVFVFFVGAKGEPRKEARLTTLAFTVQVNMVIVHTSTGTIS